MLFIFVLQHFDIIVNMSYLNHPLKRAQILNKQIHQNPLSRLCGWENYPLKNGKSL